MKEQTFLGISKNIVPWKLRGYNTFYDRSIKFQYHGENAKLQRKTLERTG